MLCIKIAFLGFFERKKRLLVQQIKNRPLRARQSELVEDQGDIPSLSFDKLSLPAGQDYACKSMGFLVNLGMVRILFFFVISLFTTKGFAQPLNVTVCGDTTICLGESTIINKCGSVTGGVLPYSYSWSPNVSLNSDTIFKPIATPLTTTLYILTVTDSLGAQDWDSIWVWVFPNPVIDAGPNDIIDSASSVQLNAVGASAYSWSPITGLSCTSCSNPIASPTATITYYLTGTSANGCQSIDSVTVCVRPDTAKCYATSIKDINISNLNITITPNPFSSSTEIVIANPEARGLPAGQAGMKQSPQNITIALYNLLGKKEEIATSRYAPAQANTISGLAMTFRIERGNLPAGLYFFRMTNDEGVLGTGKLIVQD